MLLRADVRTHLVFDLDDTLYPERRFVESGFRAVSRRFVASGRPDPFDAIWACYLQGGDAFGWLVGNGGDDLGLGLPDLLAIYRGHLPDIVLPSATATFLSDARRLGLGASLITDGRSVTQRNKLRALGLTDWFDEVVISEEFGSEKPDRRNYLHVQERHPGKDFVFFGDNTSKDFDAPAELGWQTVCLRDVGEHIHPQDLTREPVPDRVIAGFEEIEFC